MFAVLSLKFIVFGSAQPGHDYEPGASTAKQFFSPFSLTKYISFITNATNFFWNFTSSVNDNFYIHTFPRFLFSLYFKRYLFNNYIKFPLNQYLLERCSLESIYKSVRSSNCLNMPADYQLTQVINLSAISWIGERLLHLSGPCFGTLHGVSKVFTNGHFPSLNSCLVSQASSL